MDGATLLRELRMILQETSDTSWMDKKSSYDYLYEAAVSTAERTNLLTGTQTITTVSSQVAYNLNPDFLKIQLTDNEERPFIKFNDGSDDYFIYQSSYDSIISGDNDDDVEIPSCFAITDAGDQTRLTGTCTSTGTLSNEESNLIVSGAPFSGAAVGDIVHNTTDGSSGYVVATSSTTTVTTSLFGGTNNYWTSGDAYILNPQSRFKLVLDPPPADSGNSITVYYIKRPNPVYSPYRAYSFPVNFKGALVKYAAWLYKYRDREPNYGDAFFKFWDSQTRLYGRTINKALGGPRRGFRVIMKKSANPMYSYK
jgi:hypothetical protein